LLNQIVVHGARQHNLKNISVEIQTFVKPTEKEFVPFGEWLKGAAPATAARTPVNGGQSAARSSPGEPPSTPPARPEEIPEAVQHLWRRMSNLSGICEVFGGLKKELLEALGEERGTKSYQVLLATHGVENPNQFKSVQKARQCAFQMWMKVQSARQAQEVA
jgi:hypothetical protein